MEGVTAHIVDKYPHYHFQSMLFGMQAKIKDITSIWPDTTEWGFGKRTMMGPAAKPLPFQSHTELAKAQRTQQLAAAVAAKPPSVSKPVAQEVTPEPAALPELYASESQAAIAT